MLVSVRVLAWSQRVYTLPQVIKEEKKDEERVGNLESKREKVEKLKVKKRNKRGGSEGLVSLFCFFFFFHFCPRE